MVKGLAFYPNPQKCVCMLFSRKQIPIILPPPLPVILNDIKFNSVYSHKHIGWILDKKMAWSEHIYYLSLIKQ